MKTALLHGGRFFIVQKLYQIGSLRTSTFAISRDKFFEKNKSYRIIDTFVEDCRFFLYNKLMCN